ncbi:Gfo/Idh/MocA family oxidoreductase [Paenibacillus hemerocallicola]|uniref:Gfo/Idh/MocA family oxidoreductase n=1 Tax=Paenibacillus hemerocallicola TaxID=1172614 RepID=A0A5C4TIV4_9BACL|nr:Gfo/Idh/MocA family oxidoreductase [Paenibacillus hemerocallicola]TNJ68379.1 Gfo/Idh/MocA family oxidoreductase [Paenibacillus hemerocallicola]
MGNPWKMGLVGLGGSRRSAAYMHHPRIRVTAVCDSDSALLEKAGNELGVPEAGRFESFEQMLNADIDIVMIGTPVPFHAEQTIAALEAGKHVLCEVTAASTVEDCFRIIEAVERTGRTYMMAENTVYFHYFQSWKRWVREGLFGTIFYAEGEYVHEIRSRIIDPLTGQSYWRDRRAPLHYCSHSLGPILEILNDRIVKATGSGTSKTILPAGGVGSIDMQVALFETAGGATIKLLRSSVAPRKPEIGHYALYGSKGQLENGRVGYGSDGWIYVEGHPEFGGTAQPLRCETRDPLAPEEATLGGHGTSEYYLIRDFIDALDSGAQPRIDVYRAMEFTLPGLIAQQAVEKGNVWLDVPTVR